MTARTVHHVDDAAAHSVLTAALKSQRDYSHVDPGAWAETLGDLSKAVHFISSRARAKIDFSRLSIRTHLLRHHIVCVTGIELVTIQVVQIKKQNKTTFVIF